MVLSSHLVDEAQSEVKVEMMVEDVTLSEAKPVMGLKLLVMLYKGSTQVLNPAWVSRDLRYLSQVAPRPAGIMAETPVEVALVAEEVVEAEADAAVEDYTNTKVVSCKPDSVLSPTNQLLTDS